MAIPPEPIEQVIEDAGAAVLAEVAGVTTQDAQEPSAPGKVARQVVELKVQSVLFGALAKAGATVQAVKPAGAYALRAGNHGPFLLRAIPGGTPALEILGRYGPDTYSAARIEEAAKRSGKS
ncbi:MAG: hypothetical protein ACYC8T_26900 [Myxococcaceae bacterium]